MAFLEFERFEKNGHTLIRPTGRSLRLAGYNLIYEVWKRRSKPLNQGWHVSASELITINDADPATHLFVIDWNPNSDSHLGLIELLDVYAFTWSDDGNEPSWTPIMLNLRDVFSDGTTNAADRKRRLTSGLPEPTLDEPHFVEFLYLKGADRGWNWGMSGMTNAAFLHGPAREYFRRFF